MSAAACWCEPIGTPMGKRCSHTGVSVSSRLFVLPASRAFQPSQRSTAYGSDSPPSRSTARSPDADLTSSSIFASTCVRISIQPIASSSSMSPSSPLSS